MAAPDISQQAFYRDGNAVFDKIHVLEKIEYDFTKSGPITITDLNVTGIATFGTSSTTIDGATDTIQVGTALTIGHTQGLQFHTQNLHSTGFEVNQINVSGIATIGSDLYLTGALVDTSGSPGATGKLLQSTGSGTEWIAANATSVNNAINVGVNLNGTNSNQFVSFFGANSGNQPNRVDAAFTYNPSTNTMSGINYSGTSTFTNTKVTGIATAAILEVEGQLRDGDGNFGSAGQVLTSDGTDTKWDASSNLPAGSSAQVAITDVSSGTPRLLLATGSGTQKDVLSNSSLTYNTSTQVITGRISSIDNHDTDNLSEGSSNLYHTTARVRAAVSATGDLSYNSSSGQFSVSVPSAFVSGMIILWSGNTGNIPTGFVLCDGNSGTPNLTDRFVVGAGSAYGVGATGGSSSVTLSTANLPSHNHSFSGSTSHSHTINNHTHSFSGSGSNTHNHGVPKGRGGSQASISHYVSDTSVEQTQGTFATTNATISISVSGTTGNPSDRGTNSQSVSISGTTGSEGSGTAHENRPPYYALCYIMKT